MQKNDQVKIKALRAKRFGASQNQEQPAAPAQTQNAQRRNDKVEAMIVERAIERAAERGDKTKLEDEKKLGA